MSKSARRGCRQLAANQLGVISRSQAMELGMSARQVNYRLHTGELVIWLPGVYLTASDTPTWRQALVCASLWAGPEAVVSHRAAAALQGLDGVKPGAVELTVTEHRGLHSDKVILHHTDKLPPCDVTTLGPFRVTEVSRTILDLGACRDADTEAAMESALRRGWTSITKLRWRLDEIGGRGVPGTGRLRALLEDRDPSTPPSESDLEVRFDRFCRRFRLPSPVRQFEVWDGATFVARIDRSYPGPRLALEIDGWGPHSGKARWQHDLWRRNRLTTMGWRVLNFTWQDLEERPQQVADQIRRMLGTSKSPIATIIGAGGGPNRSGPGRGSAAC